MAFKTLERALLPIPAFDDKGDQFTGTIIAVRTDVPTPHGVQTFVDLADDDGEKYAIPLYANLMSYPWEDMVGKRVQITFMGYKKNEKSGRKYKEFIVGVDDEDDDDGEAEAVAPAKGKKAK